ncbi:MAG: DUF4169 family protein [Pseudomonadota bacterium]
MSALVNLRRHRKAKARQEKEAQAAANRLAFGESKAARRKRQADQAKRTALLDGAQREESEPRQARGPSYNQKR